MKSHEMREMAIDELEQHHETLMDELVNMRIKLSVKQLDNPVRIRYLRREVARAKTILRDKRLGAKPGEALQAKSNEAK
jgi:large subunit ribosomal protein L29